MDFFCTQPYPSTLKTLELQMLVLEPGISPMIDGFADC